MTTKTNSTSTRQEAVDALGSLIDEIRIGMLTTLSSGNALRSRPMLTAARKFDGDLWFFTEINDPKVREIEVSPEVAISYACPERQQYVSVSGTAEVVCDESKLELLWDDELNRWFPGGKATTDLALLRVSIHDGEYWDLHRNIMFKLGSMLRELISGDHPNELEHQKISWPDKKDSGSWA